MNELKKTKVHVLKGKGGKAFVSPPQPARTATAFSSSSGSSSLSPAQLWPTQHHQQQAAAGANGANGANGGGSSRSVGVGSTSMGTSAGRGVTQSAADDQAARRRKALAAAEARRASSSSSSEHPPARTAMSSSSSPAAGGGGGSGSGGATSMEVDGQPSAGATATTAATAATAARGNPAMVQSTGPRVPALVGAALTESVPMLLASVRSTAGVPHQHHIPVCIVVHAAMLEASFVPLEGRSGDVPIYSPTMPSGFSGGGKGVGGGGGAYRLEYVTNFPRPLWFFVNSRGVWWDSYPVRSIMTHHYDSSPASSVNGC